ncbi:MAG: hypothetical protein LBQ47_08835, partial [Endomicrobium sp.]|nr:hypothetical protein [Endomicrobium sp.]
MLSLFERLKIKKTTAIVTSVCFIFSIFSSYLPARAFAQPILPAAQINKVKISDFALPFNIGRVTDGVDFKSDRVIVQIQDLHSHEETQKNIASILSFLDSTYKIGTIYVEGAAGDVDTSWLANISDDSLKKSITDNLIKKGILTGSELFSVNSGKTAILKGIENKKLYLENFQRLVKINADRDKAKNIFPQMKRLLEYLSYQAYGEENKKIVKILKKNAGGEISSDKYFTLLIKKAKKHNLYFGFYPSISLFSEIIGVQSKINKDKLNSQLETFLNNLKSELSYAQYSELISYYQKPNSEGLFYFKIDEIIKKNNLENKYPEIVLFLKYIALNQKMNPLDLVREERELIRELMDRAAENEIEKEMVFLNNFLDLTERFFENQITAPEYKYFEKEFPRFKVLWTKYTRFSDFPGIEEYYSLFEKFYKVNVERNNVFVDVINGSLPEKTNGVKSFQENEIPQNVSSLLSAAKEIDVVITGGFHTQDVSRVLQDARQSYVVITPGVTQSVSGVETLFNADVARIAKYIPVNMYQKALLSNRVALLDSSLEGVVASYFSKEILDALKENALAKGINISDAQAESLSEISKSVAKHVAEQLSGFEVTKITANEDGSYNVSAKAEGHAEKTFKVAQTVSDIGEKAQQYNAKQAGRAALISITVISLLAAGAWFAYPLFASFQLAYALSAVLMYSYSLAGIFKAFSDSANAASALASAKRMSSNPALQDRIKVKKENFLSFIPKAFPQLEGVEIRNVDDLDDIAQTIEEVDAQTGEVKKVIAVNALALSILYDREPSSVESILVHHEYVHVKGKGEFLAYLNTIFNPLSILTYFKISPRNFPLKVSNLLRTYDEYKAMKDVPLSEYGKVEYILKLLKSINDLREYIRQRQHSDSGEDFTPYNEIIIEILKELASDKTLSQSAKLSGTPIEAAELYNNLSKIYLGLSHELRELEKVYENNKSATQKSEVKKIDINVPIRDFFSYNEWEENNTLTPEEMQYFNLRINQYYLTADNTKDAFKKSFRIFGNNFADSGIGSFILRAVYAPFYERKRINSVRNYYDRAAKAENKEERLRLLSEARMVLVSDFLMNHVLFRQQYEDSLAIITATENLYVRGAEGIINAANRAYDAVYSLFGIKALANFAANAANIVTHSLWNIKGKSASLATDTGKSEGSESAPEDMPAVEAANEAVNEAANEAANAAAAGVESELSLAQILIRLQTEYYNMITNNPNADYLELITSIKALSNIPNISSYAKEYLQIALLEAAVKKFDASEKTAADMNALKYTMSLVKINQNDPALLNIAKVDALADALLRLKYSAGGREYGYTKEQALVFKYQTLIGFGIRPAKGLQGNIVLGENFFPFSTPDFAAEANKAVISYDRLKELTKDAQPSSMIYLWLNGGLGESVLGRHPLIYAFQTYQAAVDAAAAANDEAALKRLSDIAQGNDIFGQALQDGEDIYGFTKINPDNFYNRDENGSLIINKDAKPKETVIINGKEVKVPSLTGKATDTVFVVQMPDGSYRFKSIMSIKIDELTSLSNAAGVQIVGPGGEEIAKPLTEIKGVKNEELVGKILGQDAANGLIIQERYYPWTKTLQEDGSTLYSMNFGKVEDGIRKETLNPGGHGTIAFDLGLRLLNAYKKYMSDNNLQLEDMTPEQIEQAKKDLGDVVFANGDGVNSGPKGRISAVTMYAVPRQQVDAKGGIFGFAAFMRNQVQKLFTYLSELNNTPKELKEDFQKYGLEEPFDTPQAFNTNTQQIGVFEVGALFAQLADRFGLETVFEMMASPTINADDNKKFEWAIGQIMLWLNMNLETLRTSDSQDGRFVNDLMNKVIGKDVPFVQLVVADDNQREEIGFTPYKFVTDIIKYMYGGQIVNGQWKPFHSPSLKVNVSDKEPAGQYLYHAYQNWTYLNTSELKEINVSGVFSLNNLHLAGSVTLKNESGRPAVLSPETLRSFGLNSKDGKLIIKDAVITVDVNGKISVDSDSFIQKIINAIAKALGINLNASYISKKYKDLIGLEDVMILSNYTDNESAYIDEALNKAALGKNVNLIAGNVGINNITGAKIVGNTGRGYIYAKQDVHENGHTVTVYYSNLSPQQDVAIVDGVIQTVDSDSSHYETFEWLKNNIEGQVGIVEADLNANVNYAQISASVPMATVFARTNVGAKAAEKEFVNITGNKTEGEKLVVFGKELNEKKNGRDMRNQPMFCTAVDISKISDLAILENLYSNAFIINVSAAEVENNLKELNAFAQAAHNKDIKVLLNFKMSESGSARRAAELSQSIKDTNAIGIDGVIFDYSHSAAEAEKDSLKEIAALIKKGNADAVIAVKTDSYDEKTFGAAGFMDFSKWASEIAPFGQYNKNTVEADEVARSVQEAVESAREALVIDFSVIEA